MDRFVRAFWPVAAWMVVVFCMSFDFASADHTSRFLVPFLHWLDPNISHETIERIHFLIRKAGHITEYGMLGWLTLRALRIYRPPASRWSWSLAAIAIAVSAAYGATDEFHQTFVPSRGPALHDVAIDTGGAAVGVALGFLATRRRKVEVPA